MNISPILLLSIGASFALLYGVIITIGWAMTRRNRKKFHQSVGLNEIELFDLETWKPLDKFVNTVSLSNNIFKAENGQMITPEFFNCYVVENESPEFPQIKKGYLIFIDPHTGSIAYAFAIPNLDNYR